MKNQTPEAKEANEFYHSTKKGCKLIPAMKVAGKRTPTKRGDAKNFYLHFQLCVTHGKDVCRCGWEFKKHPVSTDC